MSSSTLVRSIWIASLLLCGATAQTPQAPTPAEDLPEIKQLPALLEPETETTARRIAAWQASRPRLIEMIQAYEYGHMPPACDVRPVTITLSTQQDSWIDERVTLQIESDPPIRFDIAIFKPDGAGPFPVILTEVHAIHDIASRSLVIEQGYMLVQYEREDLDPDQKDVVGPAQQAFPDHDWATLAVWAWGAMRSVDYLLTRPDVDPQRIAITGHSRGGKMALLAGALDERFSLVVPNGSGCGGAGSFRDSPKSAESLEQITDPQRFGYWFHPRLRDFAGRESRLPFDQHTLKALVAPRALLCTEASEDLWANPSGSLRTSQAAQPVFELLSTPTRNGFHLREGQHDQTLDDWRALLEFARWHWDDEPPKDAGRFSTETAVSRQ